MAPFFINKFMKFHELYSVIHENNIIVEEGFLDFFKNPKAVVAIAVLLGLTHVNYSYPTLKRIIQQKLATLPKPKVEEIKQKIPEVIDSTIVHDLLAKIDTQNSELIHKLPSANSPETPQKLPNTLIKDAPKTSDDEILSSAYDYIKKSEGVRNKMYKDIYGNWTIGIGHLVKPEEMKLFSGKTLTDKEIQTIFVNDMRKKLSLAKKHFRTVWDKFSPELKVTILDGYFRGDLSGSPKTILLMKAGRYKEAAKEYLNNKEYKQAVKDKSGVAPRMEHNAQVIASEANRS